MPHLTPALEAAESRARARNPKNATADALRDKADSLDVHLAALGKAAKALKGYRDIPEKLALAGQHVAASVYLLRADADALDAAEDARDKDRAARTEG